MDDGIVWLLIVLGIGLLCVMPTFYKLSREERRQSSLIDVLLKQGSRCEDPRREDAHLEGMCRGYAVRINRSRMEQTPRRVAEPAREEGLIDSVFNALPSGRARALALRRARTALLRVTLTRALPAGLWVGRRGRALRPDRAKLALVRLHKLIGIALILDAREAPVDDAMLAAFDRPVGSS